MCKHLSTVAGPFGPKSKLLKARTGVENASFPASGRASLPRFMLPLLPVSGPRIKPQPKQILFDEVVGKRVLSSPVDSVLRKQEVAQGESQWLSEGLFCSDYSFSVTRNCLIVLIIPFHCILIFNEFFHPLFYPTRADNYTTQKSFNYSETKNSVGVLSGHWEQQS